MLGDPEGWTAWKCSGQTRYRVCRWTGRVLLQVREERYHGTYTPSGWVQDDIPTARWRDARVSDLEVGPKA